MQVDQFGEGGEPRDARRSDRLAALDLTFSFGRPCLGVCLAKERLAYGLAVSAAINKSADPTAAARELLTLLHRAPALSPLKN